MTLVYAHTSASGIRVYSDTQITNTIILDTQSHSGEIGASPKQIPGELKILLIGPQHVVGYAGSGYRAIRFLRTVCPNAATHDLVSVLYDCHLQSKNPNDEADFLVASTLEPDVIHRIAGRQHIKCSDQTWIGNAQAAGMLRREIDLDRLSNLTEHISADSVHAAFERILQARSANEGGAAPSIGGICISVRQIGGAFRYTQSCEVAVGHMVQTLSSEFTKLRFGTNQDGRVVACLQAIRRDLGLCVN